MPPKLKAQEGLKSLKQSVLEYLASKPDGETHASICHDLGLESDFEGKHKNFLSYNLLGLMLKDGSILFSGSRKERRFYLRTQRD